jgi:O-antigen biosynthesis protein WbqP
MDVRCFFGTLYSVIKSDGVIEGGTGSMIKEIASSQENESINKN